MTENFLEYVDNIQKKYCEKHEIRNRNFICYLELKSIDILTHEEFYVAKSRKSRLLIHHNNIWVDLTDYDIIDIICSFDKELVLKIVDRFKAGYNKEWTDFEFEIQGKRFRGKGINYKDFDLDKEAVLLPVFCSLERKPAKKKVNTDSEDFLNYVIILKSKLCMIL